MKWNFRTILRRSAAVSAALLIAIGGWYGWGLYQSVYKLTGNNNPFQIVEAFSAADLKQTDGRTNILLAGYSADDANHGGAQLTDSIMILSIDQSNKSAAVVSVPRDLYVDIDGYGYSKINAAYVYGEQQKFAESGYADGGMGLLEKTVEENLGIHSNYQALINYTAFKDLVDAVGGISVTIKSSSSYGLYDPNTNLKLSNGTQNLNGQTALNLARSRGEGYGSYGFAQGDFTRTQNQQAILLALKDKAGASLNLGKITNIADAVGDNIETDLQLNEIKTLYSVSKKIDAAAITTITLNDVDGTNLLTSYTTKNGQSALIPAEGVDNFSAIQQVVDKLLSISRSGPTGN